MYAALGFESVAGLTTEVEKEAFFSSGHEFSLFLLAPK